METLNEENIPRSRPVIGLVFWLFLCLLHPQLTFAQSNFATISFGDSVSIEVPRNWTVISDDQRMLIDTWVEATGNLANWPDQLSNLPFAANFYWHGAVVGMVNLRFYPEMTITQGHVKSFSNEDISYLDNEIRTALIESQEDTGLKVANWGGTNVQEIGGLLTLVTEYQRNSSNGQGIFRVRLVRVLAGPESFTLTVSYLTSKANILENITDRIITSVRM